MKCYTLVRIAACYVALFCCFLLAGCKYLSHRSSTSVSATIHFPDFIKTRTALRLSGSSGRSFHFPWLEIYDKSGRLAYAGFDPARNVEILQSLPNLPKDASQLNPSGANSGLSTTVEEIQQFRSMKTDLLDGSRIRVLDVSLDECSGCSYQEGVLQSISTELARNGIDVVSLRVLSR